MHLKNLTKLALLVALNVVIARIFLIPIAFTHGNINLIDTGITLAALLYGKRAGLVVGGLSGFLLDLSSGYPQFMLFSLVIHGLEGLLLGKAKDKPFKHQLPWLLGALLVLVAGYFVANSILYGLTPATVGLISDLCQGVVGISLGALLTPRFKKLL